MNISLDNLKGYRRGNELICRCPNPAHDDQNPSFNLNLETGCYFCFGCGLRGRIDLDCKIIKEQPKNILGRKKVSFDDFRPVYHEYLKQRGIDKITAQEFEIGYSPSYRAVVLPCRNMVGGKLGDIGRLVYESSYRYLYSTGFDRSASFYGLKFMEAPMREIILVEGAFDCLKLFTLRIRNVMAILGTWLSEGQKKILSMLQVKRIFLCLDSDKAGYERSKDIGLSLINNGFDVRICRLKNRNDPGEMESANEM